MKLSLDWVQRWRLRRTVLGLPPSDVRMIVLGDLDRWQWRRDVMLTGSRYPVELALGRAGIPHPTDDGPGIGAGLGRGTNRGSSNLEWWKRLAGFQAFTVLLVLSGTAQAEYTGYGLAMTRETPGSSYSLGPQSWCCGKIPSGSVPRSAPSAFYSAVRSAFGSVAKAVEALNARLNKTSNFDPTYGATSYNSNLGGMDPNSRGSGVTAW